jgi:hypothetical protein
MIVDSVVEEVRRIREAYAKQFGYDLQAMYRDLKEKERRSGRRIVSFPPRKPKAVAQAVPVAAPTQPGSANPAAAGME